MYLLFYQFTSFISYLYVHAKRFPLDMPPTGLRKQQEKVLGSGRCPLGLCLDICRGHFLLSEQWSPVEDSKPLSEFEICQGYEAQQHDTKTKFLLVYMKKTEQDMWACVRFPHAWYAFFFSGDSGFQKWNPYFWSHNRADTRQFFSLVYCSSEIIEHRIAGAN